MSKPVFTYNPQYPSVADLKSRAKRRIPKFAFDYLEGGCNEELNLWRNEYDFRDIQLMPNYLRKHRGVDMSVELFGQRYDAPSRISGIGLQGLSRPNAQGILGKAGFKRDIHSARSTVATASIGRISEVTEGQAWFQLYHPTENR